MISIYVSFGIMVLYSLSSLTVAKPFDEEKSFNNANKLNCEDSNDGSDYEKSNPNSLSDYYKPRSRFEGSDKYSSRPFEFDKKRSAVDEFSAISGPLQKRQVGVVYKEDIPIGILQPYQRSYRFIPVNEEENLNEINKNQLQENPLNLPSVMDIDKREVNLDPAQMDESYPSILTNFKIVNKLDKKRNYDALTDENVQDLKATIRRLRSSNSHNNEQIEEELKNILNDMGLIEDEEIHGEKREITEEQIDDENEPLSDDELKTDKERNKRDETCIHGENTDTDNKMISEQNLLSNDEKRVDAKNNDFSRTSFSKRENEDVPIETYRKKRQKQETATGLNKENSELVENLKDSGDLMVSGNKSPLASSSDIVEQEAEGKESDKRSYGEENDDYEKRVEREIQSKINSLKEEVKREIEALKKRQRDDDDEDMQRKKRQVFDNLVNEETDELNPAMNPDGELKPLVRKRRELKKDKKEVGEKLIHVRNKRQITPTRIQKRNNYASDIHNYEKNYKAHEESDEGGELLGDDEVKSGVSKRQIYSADKDYVDQNDENSNSKQMLSDRSKRSGILPKDLSLYDNRFFNNYFYDNNGRLKRQNIREKNSLGYKFRRNKFIPFTRDQWRSRFRRRISENQVMVNRPQRLSDMSDIDLFGALPKSYDGELSRYKRVK